VKRYLPIYIGLSQAKIIKKEMARELVGVAFHEPEAYEYFLAGIDISKSALESVTIDRFENNLFHARLFLLGKNKARKVKCPLAGALALAMRRNAHIFTGENVLNVAAIDVPE